jgi:hypothetical protein
MTFKTSSALCALAFSALAVSGLQAQTNRDATKADTSVTTLPKPAGEMSVANQDKGSKPMPSTVSRDAVKSDAKGARAAGQIPSGEASTANQGKKPATRRTEGESRAKVKAEAATAASAGGLSRGQSSVPNQDRGGIKP